MSLIDINEKLNQMGNTWEHYKSVNNERIKQIEKKGNSDSMIELQLEKISNSMNEQKNKINQLEASLARPDIFNSFKAEDNEYKSALNLYLKKGMEEGISNLEVKRDLTTSLGDGTSFGGYLLNPSIQKMILDRISEICVMRKICSVQEISTSSLDVLDNTNFTPSWIAENGTITDSDNPVFSKKTITTHDLVAQPRVSQRLLDDSAIDIESWLAYQLSEDFAYAEENAFLNGTGLTANQPTGILSYAGTDANSIETITSSNGTKQFDENDILELYYSLKEQYVANSSFLMSRSAIQEIRKLKDPISGQYLWNPSLLSGKDDTILGCPVYQSALLPAISANSTSIILGDFKEYQIVDRIGIRILRDPYTSKPYIRFYTTKRVGGDVIRKDAFRILKSSNI